jgi:hypothetical protein
MGRTTPSITQVFHEEQAAFSVFRRALPPSDQRVLDDLFRYAQLHLAEAAYAAAPIPMDVFFVSMLLEERKEVIRLRNNIEDLSQKLEKE